MERIRTKFIALLVIVAVVVLLVMAARACQRVGVHQGYEPDQPIPFSHKIHAGDNKVPCLYCHFGAEKSRHAGIPPTNVCMNCHSVIKKDSTEIAKIYAALKERKPLEWVKVHNLPDFVYFNHRQHVKGGKISCQECHGPVETMGRMRQQEPLTMGWCISCHRDQGITPPAEHDELATEVAKEKGYPIGGLDCAKCHY